MTTINLLSLPTMVDFMEHIMKLRREFNFDFAYNRIPVSINYLRWPPHLSVKVLTKEIREKYSHYILEKCEGWLKYSTSDKFARLYLEEWDQIKRFCDYLVADDTEVELHDDFVKFINEYDKRRGTDFVKTFPEYNEFWKELNAKETR